MSSLTTTSLSILRSFLGHSLFLPLPHSVALRFSPSRRGCNRASLSRARYTTATDVCSCCSFLDEASHYPRCTREFQLHLVRRRKIHAVSSLHSLVTVSPFSLLSRRSAISPFFVAPTVSLRRISSVSWMFRLALPNEEHPTCCRSYSYYRHVMLLTHSHHHYDAMRPSLSSSRVSFLFLL